MSLVGLDYSPPPPRATGPRCATCPGRVSAEGAVDERPSSQRFRCRSVQEQLDRPALRATDLRVVGRIGLRLASVSPAQISAPFACKSHFMIFSFFTVDLHQYWHKLEISKVLYKDCMVFFLRSICKMNSNLLQYEWNLFTFVASMLYFLCFNTISQCDLY